MHGAADGPHRLCFTFLVRRPLTPRLALIVKDPTAESRFRLAHALIARPRSKMRTE